ncbi:MAG: polyribonucleotide nucleotidyltransferase, partial [Candidatus Pacebacteria bacterium]|nr:polyribonucleotide nucleotidyltransferase [Candidatus Paceibacterota bacterium]
MEKKEYSIEIGGETITAQFSDLTERANGSVILRCGDTVVLATAVMSPNKKEGQNWFPLTVDYEEKFYAAGQILGSRFMRREGRPSDDAVLSGRIIDRTIRPLFNQQIRNEIQVVTTVLSINDHASDILAVNAASIALAVSDIPWGGPVSAVRILKNREEEDFVVNPTYSKRKEESNVLELVACGKDGNINMIETEASEVNDETVSASLLKASKEIEKFQEFQKMIVSEIGKEKAKIEIDEMGEEAKSLFEKEISGKIEGAVFSGPGNDKIYALKNEWLKECKEKFPEENMSIAGDYYED